MLVLTAQDYEVRGLKGGQVAKEPGSLNGQVFVIADCHDADMYIFDHTASVTVDDCKSSHGPTTRRSWPSLAVASDDHCISLLCACVHVCVCVCCVCVCVCVQRPFVCFFAMWTPSSHARALAHMLCICEHLC
jgi:hypothetical protein